MLISGMLVQELSTILAVQPLSDYLVSPYTFLAEVIVSWLKNTEWMWDGKVLAGMTVIQSATSQEKQLNDTADMMGSIEYILLVRQSNINKTKKMESDRPADT